MESYLRSLEMTGTFRDFNPVDAARLAQLTQRTNQFNLTTKRRTEAEILDLAARPDPGTVRPRAAISPHWPEHCTSNIRAAN
jgi:predicted enzyme involved in methoxymalonyl-ACP biosynthesis